MKNSTQFAKILLLPLALICCHTPLHLHAQIISNGTDIGTLATTMTLLPVSGTGTLLVNPDSVIRNASASGVSPGLRFYDSGTYAITNNGRITNSGTTAGHQAVDTAGTLNFTFVNGATGVIAINPTSIYEVFRAAQPGGNRTGSLTNYGRIEGAGSGAVVTFNFGQFDLYNEGTIIGGIGYWGNGTGTSLTINQVAGEITSNFENSLYTASRTTTVNVSGGKMTKNLRFDGANSTNAVNLSAGEINGNLLYNQSTSTNTVTVTGGSLNGNVSFGGSLGTITFNRTDSYTYSNVISGNGALVQAGAGTTTLTGENTFSRTTTIESGGTLSIGNGGTIGSISNTAQVVANGTLQFNRSDAITFDKVISGTGGIAKFGGSSLTLTANNTLSGSSSINAGTLRLGNGGAAGSIGTSSITNNGALVFNRSDAGLVVSGGISGTGSVAQVGGGTTTLSGSNSYSGSTTVSNGVLRSGANGAFSSATGITINGGKIDVQDTTNSIVFLEILNGDITQTNGSLTATAAHSETIRLGRDVGTSATYTLDGGTLATGDYGNLQVGYSGTGVFTQNGGTNSVGGYLVLGRFTTGADVGFGTYDLNGGLLEQCRSDRISIIGEDGKGIMNVNGGTYSNAGIVVIAPSSRAVGELNINDGGVVITPRVEFGAGNGSLKFDRSDSYTFDAPIVGSGRVIKDGTGTVTFGSNNGYTRGTTVNDGELRVLGLANNANNTITVNDGGTFIFTRSDTFGNHGATILTPVVINAGGTVKNNGNLFNSIGPVTLNGGTLESTGVIQGMSFALKGPVTVNSNSTLKGEGFALGAAAVDSTTFDVATNANLLVDGTLVNGAGPAWPIKQPSSLVKSGAGSITLTGTNTYTGDTTISDGAVMVGGSGVLGGSNYNGNIALAGGNSTLVIDTSANQSLGGIISGAGSLVKTNAGTLTITGPDNSYRGTTTIGDGTLVLNGTHAGGSNYNIGNGATLAGEGRTTSSVVAASGSSISPGGESRIGELTIGGLTLNGTLNIFVDGDSTSLLTVEGNANIRGGTVSFTGTNSPAEDIYVFLNARSLTTPFAATNGLSSGSLTNYQVFYDENDGIAFLKKQGVDAVAEAVFSGPNAVIGNGSTNFNVYVYNSGGSSLSFAASGNGSDTFGAIATNTIGANSGSELSQLTFSNSGTTFGTNTATFNAVFNGTTNPTTFDIVVYNHASNDVTGTNFNFGRVHAASGLVSSTNSITVSNKNDSFRIALGVTNNNTNNYLELDSVGGLAVGESADIFATLDASKVIGRFTNFVDLISFDDSELSGAITNAPGPTIQLEGYVYTGQGVWIGSGGDWSDFDDWQEPGGTPGLDGSLSVNDTALFGTNGSGPVNLSTNAQLLSVTFSNTNSYTIAGTGTITLASSGASNAAINTLAGAHVVSTAVDLGSSIVLSNASGSALTIDGVVTGLGGLVKQGDGTTTLTAANSYSGPTTISGGTLVVTNGALGLGPVTVDGGTLKPIDLGGLTINSDLTFGAAGKYVWTLFDNTMSGPGTNFTAPIDLGGNKLSVADGAEFEMFFASAVDATNDFWDANEFLTNTWTVMTGTDLAEGTMFRPVFAEGSVTNGFNPTTFFFRATNNSLTLNFSPGLIVFPGPDEFLPGNNNYPWIVFEPNAELEVPVGVNVVIKTNVVISNTSTVLINGQFTSLAGQFTLQNGSSLGGSGTINGNLVSSGLISPGNSPGTLSIGGNFTQTSAGTFLLEAASLSNFDRMNVSGAATVDGTLAAVGFGGNNLSPGDSYQFLTAEGGISGTFDTIAVPAGLRGRFLVSGANNKFGTLLIAPATYTSMATTPNQFNVAQALDSFIGATGDRGTVSAALDTLTASQYPAAFEQMMPSQYASLPSMAFNVANALNSSMFQQLWVIRVNGKGFNASGVNLAPMQAEMGGTDDMGVFAINPSKDTKWSSFVDGNGVFANASSTGSVQNYRSQSGGVSTGAAYSWTDAFATGVYVGYQGLQAEYNSGRTIDNAVRFGVFGTYDAGDFYFNGLVGGAYHGYTVNRYINFGGLNRTATGRPGAGEFDLALGTGYDFDIGNFSWGPFTTLQYTYIGVQDFNETGAGALNLDVDPYNSSSLLYTLGAQAAYNWKVSDNVIITPTAFAGWQHEFLQNSYGINSTFATGGPAQAFNYNTASPARDNFYGGVGVTVGVGERWQATFIYSASAANQDNSSQNLYLGLGYKF